MATYSPPPGVAGPTWDTAQIKAIIDTIAAQLGLPKAIAEAAAQTESGFNPYRVGDKGSSFGLYQLHIGGELEQLPGTTSQKIAAAYDPATNARVALRQIATVYHANPDADPGAIVAAAQRPADRAGYARVIDSILGTRPPATVLAAQPAGGGSPFGHGDGTTTYKLTPVGPSLTIWSWDRIGFALLGGMLVLLGLYLTFRGGDSLQLVPPRSNPAPAPTDDGKPETEPDEQPAPEQQPRPRRSRTNGRGRPGAAGAGGGAAGSAEGAAEGAAEDAAALA